VISSEPLSALEISRRVKPRPVAEIAEQMGLSPQLLEPYGSHVAKIKLEAIEELSDRPRAKYVLVTAITPTPLGEGKTATSIGLAQALGRVGKRSVVALRQGSMGPTFGIKGGGAGGGQSQLVPFEAVNLHLTGDLHAVTAAHNLLAAMVDNHLYHGNELGIDPYRVNWRRVLDVDDRALRSIVVGLGGRLDGVTRQSAFDITAASEVMAILALAGSLHDLRARLGRIVFGYDSQRLPLTAENLKAAGAMTVIMREAIKPNLVQTLEGTPALVHAGPFGNIAHGNSSVVADQIAIHAGEYLVTEAGFGADMGAERFFNIKCRTSGLVPDAAVMVATVRGLKAHTGRYRVVAGRPLPPELMRENPDDVYKGGSNLLRQIENIQLHGVNVVVAINAFDEDFESEHEAIRVLAGEMGVRAAVSRTFSEGGAGGVELAEAVIDACRVPSAFTPLYPDEMPLKQKIEAIATRVYGAAAVQYSPAAVEELDRLQAGACAQLPVCIAKTHLSISSDPTLKGVPTGWTLPIREARVSAGAGFVYCLAGDIATMPGLSSHPAAEQIDIDADGNVVGLR
jgi:formate--tetrahydrofolate ligase